jgi:hypothetical protein
MSARRKNLLNLREEALESRAKLISKNSSIGSGRPQASDNFSLILSFH